MQKDEKLSTMHVVR